MKKLVESELVKKFLRKHSHMNWALADQAMVSGVNFFTGILLARFLGIQAFGQFTLIWMAVLFVNSIQIAMISSPMMSIGPKQDKKDETIYYRAVMTQQFLFSIFTFLLLFIGMYFAGTLKPEWGIKELALPLAFAGTFFQYQDFLRRYFFCRQQASNAFTNDAISYLGQITILLILFFSLDLKVDQALWVIALTSLLAIFFGLTKVNRKLSTYKDFMTVTKRHFLFSKWLTLMAIFQWFSGNLVFILTGAYLGSTSVGILKSAQNIMALTHVVFQAMENFVPVRASRIYVKDGMQSLTNYKNKIIYIGVCLTSFFSCIIFLFSADILQIIYGDKFSSYSFVLQFFSIIYIFMFLGFPYRAALRAVENTKSIFWSQILAALFVVFFGGLLINTYGLKGALITLLSVYIIVSTFLHFSFLYINSVKIGVK
jgi:O-antigen/teichoic acid export membrane protein